MQSAAGDLQVSPEVAEAMPGAATTIHRLLGQDRFGEKFRHNRAHPLPLDVLVVDEASMIDLALMVKLMEALPENCRLILLGDREQLASVEAGAVLSAICAQPGGFSPPLLECLRELTGNTPEPLSESKGGLSESVVVLTKNYRFTEASGLGQLAGLVNAGDGAASLECLQSGKQGVAWQSTPDHRALDHHLETSFLAGLGDWIASPDATMALKGLARRVLLTPYRHGPWGSIALNSRIRDLLFRHGLIPARGEWYPGRPIMVTRNDLSVGLFNGDVGVCVPDEGGNPSQVAFETASGVRTVPVTRLPQHETVYVMTVHKSQGSEFDQVILLTGTQESPLLTRELIYTAVTRARSGVAVWGSQDVFRRAVERPVQRASRLADHLWPGQPVDISHR